MSETHSSTLAHQFDDPEQQKEATTLGMWAFLATEVMFFGGLFTGYTVYRSKYPHAFDLGSLELDLWLGGVNTVFLIASSLTMAMAVYSSQLGRRKSLVASLLATIFLGSLFLGVKVIEYSHKYATEKIPGIAFHYEGVLAPQVELFFSFYFAMTGLHALHMIIGIAILAILVVQAWKGMYSEEYYAPIEITGLYWHFVDIVWIFLFPLLYLLGRH